MTTKTESITAIIQRLKPSLDELMKERQNTTSLLSIFVWDIGFSREEELFLNIKTTKGKELAKVFDKARIDRVVLNMSYVKDTSVIDCINDQVKLPDKVRNARQTDEGIEVFLENSNVAYFLPKNNDNFRSKEECIIRSREEGVTVLIASNEHDEVIDISELNSELISELNSELNSESNYTQKQSGTLRLLQTIPWYMGWFGAVSKHRAIQFSNAVDINLPVADQDDVGDIIFKAIQGSTNCDPLNIDNNCIPFRYPDNGCQARAHEMCRLMMKMGLNPMKLWIFPSPGNSLKPSTENKPNCEASWIHHVVPILKVRDTQFPQTKDVIIDPSLFDKAVEKSALPSRLKDPNLTTFQTDTSFYYKDETTSTCDPNYEKTNRTLASYRVGLMLRVVLRSAPPYSCPPSDGSNPTCISIRA